jgi:hypothetical protein
VVTADAADAAPAAQKPASAMATAVATCEKRGKHNCMVNSVIE